MGKYRDIYDHAPMEKIKRKPSTFTKLELLLMWADWSPKKFKGEDGELLSLIASAKEMEARRKLDVIKMEEAEAERVAEEERVREDAYWAEQKQMAAAAHKEQVAEHIANLEKYKDRITAAHKFIDDLNALRVLKGHDPLRYRRFFNEYGEFKLDVDQERWMRLLYVASERFKTGDEVTKALGAWGQNPLKGIPFDVGFRNCTHRASHYFWKTSENAKRMYGEYIHLNKTTRDKILHDAQILRGA